jgi:hypothetical protein
MTAVKKYVQIFFLYPIQILLFIQLEGFGWSSLVGIDVNNENFCGAGIIHTASQQIGCLYRLEPNKQAKVNSFFLIIKMEYFLY